MCSGAEVEMQEKGQGTGRPRFGEVGEGLRAGFKDLEVRAISR